MSKLMEKRNSPRAKKRTKERGSWGFGIDGKEVEVEGVMKRKHDKDGNITKEKFRADSKDDRKMFRQIDKNEKKRRKTNKKRKISDGTNTDEFLFGEWGPSSVT